MQQLNKLHMDEAFCLDAIVFTVKDLCWMRLQAQSTMPGNCQTFPMQQSSIIPDLGLMALLSGQAFHPALVFKRTTEIKFIAFQF